MTITFNSLADLITTMDKHPIGASLFIVALALATIYTMVRRSHKNDKS